MVPCRRRLDKAYLFAYLGSMIEQAFVNKRGCETLRHLRLKALAVAWASDRLLRDGQIPGSKNALCDALDPPRSFSFRNRTRTRPRTRFFFGRLRAPPEPRSSVSVHKSGRGNGISKATRYPRHRTEPCPTTMCRAAQSGGTGL
jgi:hypothetical protein